MRRAVAWFGMVVLAAAVFATVGAPGCVFYLNPQCNDKIRNGEETDIDCGGGCVTCEIGSSCRITTDCEDSTCEGGTCTALPCFNGKRDGNETDVDCGGGTCRKCAGGRTCAGASDCVTGNCVAGGTCFELSAMAFADAVSYQSGNKAYVLFSGDLNGDGRVDLAAANELDSTVSVFLNTNNATGAFQRVAPPFATGAYPTGGAIVDMNRDGKLDVVTANYHGNSVSVLLGTGTGALGAAATYPTIEGGETSNLAVGDLNGDGNLDVIAANPQRHSVSEFLGSADGTLSPAVDIPVDIEGSSEPFSAAIGDFDGNGANDVAIADNRSGKLFLRLGNGDGTFQPETNVALRGVASFIVLARDINLDGKLDVISANRGSNDVTVLLGRGDGNFKRALVAATGPVTGPYALAVADFNLDGVLDVITANYQSSSATILLGNGDGTFEPAINAGITGSVSYGVAAGDFNGDGKTDFAISNAVSNDVTVKLSTGQ